MKAGPKGTLSAPPLDLRRFPRRGGDRCIRFVERYITVPKGTGARKRMKLRPWQRAIVHGVLDEPRPRQGLVSIPARALWAAGRWGRGGPGPGRRIRRAPGAHHLEHRPPHGELDDNLGDRVHVYADRLHEPRTDSTFMALPADPGSLQGWDPSLAIVDELHVVTDDTFEAMAARVGKRDRSLLLAISTPPRTGQDDSVMRRLVDHGRDGGDPSFYFREFAAGRLRRRRRSRLGSGESRARRLPAP